MIAMATASQMPMATEFVMNLKLWVAPMQQLVTMMKRTQTRMVHAITVHVVTHLVATRCRLKSMQSMEF